MESLDPDRYVIATLHIIFYYPNCWSPLAECIVESEDFEGHKERLIRMLNGEYDEHYLQTIEQHTPIRLKELEIQRLRLIGHINGILLEKLTEVVHERIYDDEERLERSNESPSIIDQFEYWFQMMLTVRDNATALSILATSFREALDNFLLIKKGGMRFIPWRSYIWHLNERIFQSISTIPQGRRYLLTVVKKYVENVEKHETRLFFHFLLFKQRSSLKNCLSEELVVEPWFHQLIRNCCPQVIELLPEALISSPDIQYNAPWKEELRSIMLPRTTQGLKSAHQKQVLAWSLHFATNVREFWMFMAANRCLKDFLTKLDIELIKGDESLQVAIFEDFVLARLLSQGTFLELCEQIDNFVQIFPYISEKHLPKLLLRLTQHLLKDDHPVPQIDIRMAYPFSQKQFEAIVKREYALMEGMLQVLNSQLSSQIYPNAMTDLNKFWRSYGLVEAVSFINNTTRNALEYYESTGEFPHFFERFISDLDDEDMDLFIKVLWDEGLLDEDFSAAIMSGINILFHHEMCQKLLDAISRNGDEGEIMESLNLRFL